MTVSPQRVRGEVRALAGPFVLTEELDGRSAKTWHPLSLVIFALKIVPFLLRFCRPESFSQHLYLFIQSSQLGRMFSVSALASAAAQTLHAAISPWNVSHSHIDGMRSVCLHDISRIENGLRSILIEPSDRSPSLSDRTTDGIDVGRYAHHTGRQHH